jgi:acyl-CoA thioester hydrolase
MPTPPARPLDAYPFRIVEKLRYGDTDRQGHINNAVYATLSECARTAFLSDREDRFAPPGTDFVIVRLAIDFRRELLWPGTVEIGTGVSRIGNKSMTLEQGIFREGELAASVENVMAIMDNESRRAIPIPAATRARLEQFLLR